MVSWVCDVQITLMKSEQGFTLVEVLVAIGLLGIVNIAIFGGLSTASKVLLVADERATAESLARSQMEDIKHQTYDMANDPPQYSIISLSGYNGYDIMPLAQRWDAANHVVSANETGIQKIAITVRHNNKSIITSGNFTLEGFKVDR